MEKGNTMENIKEKAMHFLAALSDVYRDEESRELEMFSAIKLSNDVTEDFTAMLIAMNVLFDRIIGGDGDLIDFTHVLNKLAVQYVMEAERKDND